MKLQDIAKDKVVHENLWCTLFHAKGHHRNECPALGISMEIGALNPFLIGPQIEWCEIYRKWGLINPHLLTLQKYHKTTQTPFCEFCKFMGHYVNNLWLS
jgi:hypothetical protein